MATAGDLSVTEPPARRPVVIIFAPTAVMANKVNIALALTVLTADSVTGAGYVRVAIRVADAFWIEVDCTLAAMLLTH